MRHWLLALVVVLLPGLVCATDSLVIQIDEIVPWACEYNLPLASIVSVTVTWTVKPSILATDPTPATLVNGITATGTQAVWTFTPVGHLGGYHVHVLAQTTNGARLACDGNVVVGTW